MDKAQHEKFKVLIDALGRQLADKGIRVILLSAFYDQVQREAFKHGSYAPAWAAMCKMLGELTDFEVNVVGDGNHTLTLPKSISVSDGRRLPCLVDAAHRIIIAIHVYHRAGFRSVHEADQVITWIQEQLTVATPGEE